MNNSIFVDTNYMMYVFLYIIMFIFSLGDMLIKQNIQMMLTHL